MVFPSNLPHFDTVHRLKMCNTRDVSGDVPTNVSRVCVLRTTYRLICSRTAAQILTDTLQIDCSSARSHKLLCGVDIHIITDSTYFPYSPWCVLPSQPPASTKLQTSVRQGVWPHDQALNSTVLQCVYHKTVQIFCY